METPNSSRGSNDRDDQKNTDRKRSSTGSSGSPAPLWSPLWTPVIFLVAAAFLLFFLKPFKSEIRIRYAPEFSEQVRNNNIESITIQGGEARGVLREPIDYKVTPNSNAREVKEFATRFPSEEALEEVRTQLMAMDLGGTADPENLGQGSTSPPPAITVLEPEGSMGVVWLTVLLPVLLVGGLIFFMMRRARDQFDGGILGNFVKSPAKRHDKTKQRTTFDEVAGLENAKGELQEIVEFLKNPEKFQRLGGRIPKGVLLNGPPGSGKTLLARAVAGEAGVPFFSISGSEFIQMFVGVGASRVRDMFKTAKENSPCILFIDEIDAVGRMRGAGLGGGHDEREQTLNQILTEMDGFTPNETVIVLAATNRPDVLDPALLRPGRFDRHITVERPTKKGRLAILKVHSRNIPLDDQVDLEAIAKRTVGFSGADLANLVNEAALIATREDKETVDMKDFDAARDKVLMGPRREEVITEKDKRATAYHEVGHALVAWKTVKSDPVDKVTIIPRGRALGVTQYLPEEDKVSINRSEVLAQLDGILGGRAAERLVYGDLSAGAANDLKQATRLARMMVTQWGMSDRIGPIYVQGSEEHPFLGREIAEPRDHSERTQQIIDEEVSRILREADNRAFHVLESNRDDLERLTEALIEREVLSNTEIEELIGERASAPKVAQVTSEVGSSTVSPTDANGASTDVANGAKHL